MRDNHIHCDILDGILEPQQKNNVREKQKEFEIMDFS